MKKLFSIVVGVLVAAGWGQAISGQASAPRTTAAAAPQRAAAPAAQDLVTRYCVTCHNDRLKTAGLTLQGVDAARPGTHADVWEKVVRKLRGGLMPPSGAPRPERAVLDGLRASLETAIDREALASPDPGATPLHRLNRTEYANVIRVLLSVVVDVTTLLPADDSAEGFDNIADVLGTSPALMERYVSAAAKISRLAVGNTEIAPLSTTYKVRGDLSQDQQIEGLPLGTRGGVLVTHTFPVDGEYLFKFSLLRVNFGPQYGGAAKGEQLEMSVNGERVLLRDLSSVPFYYIRGGGAPGGASQGGVPTPAAVGAAGGRGGAAGRGGAVATTAPLEVRLPIKAGPQTIVVTFMQRSAADVDDLVQRFDATTADLQTGVQFGYTTVPHLSGVEIVGPYNITGPGNSPSRARLFVCQPATAADEGPCAKRILATVARRAYRRPVTDDDVAPIFEFYQTGRQGGGFDRGIEMALRRLLADPQFVFRFERDATSAPAGSPHRITDIELASRLSFFLWSSIPDDELLSLAAQGRLSAPTTLRQQVRRMLKDGRAQALVTNFAGQWLYLRELRNRNPDLLVYPDFDDNMRQAFRRETELLFESVLREDRSIFDLLTADYTYVNERLAKHYGISGVYGADFRKVAVPSPARRGILGHASILTVTSAPNRTSPVTRGAWILENLLGSPPPLPPPDVPPLPEATNGQGLAPVATSVRERMEQHRKNAPCAGCHKIMDPIGLALENFDGVGRWRTRDEGMAIDTSGQLVDGTKVAGADGLRNALMRYPDAFSQTLTEKLLMYAVGRTAHHEDMPVVRAVTRKAAHDQYRFSSLVMAVVESGPFQMRMKKAEGTR